MFSTFAADPEKKSPSRPRPKRNQVARACDWCRQNRIKCDDSQPCQNCRTRGIQCSNAKRTDMPTLPAANREIQRLRNTISTLQANKKSQECRNHAPSKYVTPPESDTLDVSPKSDSLGTHVPRSTISSREWKGVQIHTSGAIYGPLSSSYFGARMGQFLSEALSDDPESLFLSSSENLRLEYPPNTLKCLHDSDLRGAESQSTDHSGLESLSRAQEQFFIDLLWQSFHCIYPVLVESEFCEYYDSLWGLAGDQSYRRPSSLVDSILAVCTQYGSTFLTSDEENLECEREYHVAAVSKKSHALFRRAQSLLLDEIESPSIMTLQSYIYCIIYLHNTSLLNTADMILSTAIRVAQVLRLHLPPCDPTVPEYQELHRRLWYTLVGLDCQLSMILGRPPLITVNENDYDLPGDSQEHALLSGSMLMTPGDEGISWLSFHVQSTRLLMTVRGVQNALQRHGARLIEQNNAQNMYDDPFVTEQLAACLGREIGVVYNWAHNVPTALKCSRKGSGESFSTERTPVTFNSLSPLWLQRQQILLELLYHHLQLSNFRSFVRLQPGSSSISPLSDCHNISALNHAVTLTNIVHKVLKDTDLLRGWYPVFQYQWDAALCILGFVLANPICPPTPAARRCIQTVVSCFEIMGEYSATAVSAAKIVREVGVHAERLVGKFHGSLSSRSPPSKRRKDTSATVQMISAPALTPEYLQSLTFDQPFDISDFMNGIASSVESSSMLYDETKLSLNMTETEIDTIGTSWVNDEGILSSLPPFSGGNT
ncbi:C6 transcription factor [Penicillium herquei]|nr:C6 transcription factor [Penicillium herquei]